MINNIIIFATEIVGSSYPMIRKFPNLLSPFSTTIWDKSKLVNMENEEWKDVVGYEGLYQVSNLGNVRMLEHYTPYVKGSVMKIPAKNLYIGWSNGYRTVWLCKNKIRKLKKVHRLVAEAFIPNPKKYPEIDHIDCIPTNNHFSNLKWCNRKMNQNNPISLKHQYQNQPNKKPVVKLKNGTFLEIFPSLKSTSRRGYSLQAVWSCCNKRNKTHKGFEWMYLSDYEIITNMSKNALSKTNT